MKNTIVIFLVLVSHGLTAQSSFFTQVDRFLKKNVDDQGQVAYAEIKKSPDDLNTLYESISSFDWERSTDEVKKAFLVNAYNIIVIKQVVDQLPLKSPLDNPKFFNGIAHQVAGKKMTLDDLEKGTLLKKFPDSRVHFIVVCAAKSCPPLANFAFFPDRLEKQIQDRTIEVLNLDWFVRVNNNKAEFSQIFNWYRGDFEKNGKSLIDYVNDFREEKIMAKKVGFYEYDWSLNKKG